MTGDALPADLATLLSKAAALGTSGRRVEAATPEEALGAVLDTVAACVAPRSLTILDGSGPLLVLEAAAGNLIRLIDITPRLRAGSTDLLSRSLLAADIGPVSALLSQAFPGEQIITFSTAPPATAPDPAQTGLTCPAILHQLGLTPFDSAVTDRIAHLIDAAEEVLIAIFRPGQAALPIQPDADLPDNMAKLADKAFTILATPDNPLRNNEILFFTPQSHPDLALGLTRSESGPVALILMIENMPDVAAYWANLANIPLICDPA
ncbi:hypothetical protein [Antarctobacter sp.]|uniref:hypothetical protein n=1 Tax=Antarctobacter sp. TaxID=1872577 RepID=UPI002B278F40|nr:hypothetical protein [Antarctobacter sp.]